MKIALPCLVCGLPTSSRYQMHVRCHHIIYPVKDLYIPRGADRQEQHDLVFYSIGSEKAGEGNYVFRIADESFPDYPAFLRPHGLHGRVDNEVLVEAPSNTKLKIETLYTERDPKGVQLLRLGYPSLEEDLRIKKSENSNLFHSRLHPLIDAVYNTWPCCFSDLTGVSFRNGLEIGLFLMALKLLFLAEDLRHWYGLGRSMLYKEKLCSILWSA